MRNFLIIVSFSSAIGLVASAAYGDVERPIKGTHSIGEIARTCSKSGGALWGTGDGAYGCLKGNCDGKGGECNVKCNSGGKCTGSTPTITSGKQTGFHANPGMVLTATGSKSTGTISSGKQAEGVQTADKSKKGPSHNTVVRDHRTAPIIRTPPCQGKSCK